MTDLALLLDDIRGTDQRLLAAVDQLTDDDVRAPSRLPGWTRGHVLAHLVGVAGGAARQLEHAVAGTERVDFYDGGRAGRDAAIELGARAGAGEHREQLRAALERLETALAAVGPDVLDVTTGYRDRPVSAVLTMWWREAEVHAVDLDLPGLTTAAWTTGLRAHLVDYLADRVPDGVRLDLAATDRPAERRTVGAADGAVVTVRGTADDLVLWLAGREPAGPVAAERDGVAVPLPELRPWP
ncbi:MULTISPECIES: maleylpyruvate isomerase family mycothiol-dependent enzyme [unclassified Actinotalea]|uniref:maleylpyruvate isomerase family mycothiol-dependent enzyme n=1 Tax=unclassified Actinotalea TaxID=2638618 RepID=UPI0015F70EDF|nr:MULTISPECIES: maleylpyruvate isomerase family mycothiol-dependent enzyme [unclassified Actinotalea]